MNSSHYSSEMTITEVINKYIDAVHLSRSQNTTRTYKNGLKIFDSVLRKNKIDPDKTKISDLNEDPVSWMATELKDYSPASEQCYLTSAVGFYEYLAGENLASINLPRVRLLIKQRSRRPGIRLPQFP